MICPVCGDDDSTIVSFSAETLFVKQYKYICKNNHEFSTLEIYPSCLAKTRELTSATRKIQRAMGNYRRNLSITLDERCIDDIAADYNLTATRVRQIRAKFLANEKTAISAKINEVKRRNHLP